MKKIVYRYRVSKFRHFTNGLLFAVITFISLVLCVAGITDSTATKSEIILPFMIAVISLILGFISMFGENDLPKEKI